MRATSRLVTLDDDLFCVDCDAYTKGIHMRLRATIVRHGEDLLVYSPVPVDDACAEQIDVLGRVTHLMAPNLNHHLFAAAAKQRWPDATLWGAPGLDDKLPDLPIDVIYGDDGSIFASLEHVHIRGVRFTNEVVLFHVPTRTLMCCDVVSNIVHEPELATRMLWHALGAHGRCVQHRGWRWRIDDRKAHDASMQRILEWDIQRIVMAHGDVVEEEGARVFAEALGG